MPKAVKLADFPLPANLKLALLWASLMFLYIYNDYFSLYTPGTIAEMGAGEFGPLGKADQAVLMAVSLLLAVPALMIFLSAAARPAVSRWLNIGFGLLYTAIEALTLAGSPLFYKIIVVLEMVLTVSILWLALRWPKVEGHLST